MAISGVARAGRKTAVHPAAKAGPSLRVTMLHGKFQGVIAATTPTGCLIVRIRESVRADGTTSP